MIYGFTGTRHSMTGRQQQALRAVLQISRINTLIHGDCVGADQQAHAIASEMGLTIIIHPPSNGILRAWCKCDNIMPAKPYLVRNHAIVDACDLLIAAPATDEEQMESGTWATVRYARKINKPTVILAR